MNFTKTQKFFVALWLAFAVYWLFDLFRIGSGLTPWLGLATAALGILAQVNQARKNAG